MTGFYVRVRREDGWDNVEFEMLTDDEIRAVLAPGGEPLAVRWCIALAKWIRENVKPEPSHDRPESS